MGLLPPRTDQTFTLTEGKYILSLRRMAHRIKRDCPVCANILNDESDLIEGLVPKFKPREWILAIDEHGNVLNPGSIHPMTKTMPTYIKVREVIE